MGGSHRPVGFETQMIENGDSEINVDHLMAKIREAAAQRKAQNGTSLIDASAILHDLLKANSNGSFAFTQVSLSQTPLTPSPLTPSPLPPVPITELRLQPEFTPRGRDRYHVNDLLVFHDAEFVRSAYRAILKREPDDAGFAEFLGKLRSGRFNKIDVLASLRFSTEGKQKNVRVDGLAFSGFFRRLYRVPFLGYLLELTVGILRLPILLRSYRQFEAYSVGQHERLAGHMNLTNAQLSNTLNKMDAKWSNDLSETGEQLTNDLSRVSAQLTDDLSRVSAQLTEDFSRIVAELSESHESHQKVTGLQHQQVRALFREQQEIFEEQKRLRAEIQTFLLAEQERARQQAQSQETFDERLNQARVQYAAQVNQLAQRLQQTRAELVLQERRLTLLLEEARKRLPEPFTRTQLQTVADEEPHVLDMLYASFEDHFRGSRQEIKERFKVYVPILKEAGITTDILDVGCGRGEWLEVLKEEGFEARGVELNRAMIEQCRERGLEVVAGDAIAYLQGLPENSLRAVTGLHFIEHVPFETLVKLLDEIVRTLKPGGMAIFESPNPENIMVSSYNFYFDPTHRNPLPGPVAQFLLESRGLSRVEVMMLNPLGHRIEGDGELILRFNDLFFGPRDYAVIGRKV